MTVPQSKQEWLDLLIKTSLEGGFPSLKGNGSVCMYRGNQGRKCFIGHLIPDGAYQLRLEGPLYRVMAMLPEWVPGVALLAEVQWVHDSLASQCALYGEKWSHEKMVDELRNTKIFQDCKFPA